MLLLMAGEVVTLDRWLEAVAPFAPTHPWFAILKGWVLALTASRSRSDRFSTELRKCSPLSIPLLNRLPLSEL